MQACLKHNGRKAFGLAALVCVMVLQKEQPLEAAENFMITGATVHTISGRTLAPGMVLVIDGKIVDVGERVSDRGAKTIDLTGMHGFRAGVNGNRICAWDRRCLGSGRLPP
jgi:hypothetical protein